MDTTTCSLCPIVLTKENDAMWNGYTNADTGGEPVCKPCMDGVEKQREAEHKAKKPTWEQMNADIIKRIEKDGFTHYKGRAECFADVISAFHIIQQHNNDNDGSNIIRLISPTIKGSAMMDADFDFWTATPIRTLQKLWNDKGQDLHRIIQTIKPIDQYTGEIDNTMWDELE